MATKATGQPWTEVADQVFAKRFEPVDVTVTAVVGSAGVLVADTRCSLAEARETKAELARITSAPIRWVVNTHAHFDHVWGNAEFDAPRLVPPAEFWSHRNAPKYFDRRDPHVADLMAALRDESPEWAAKLDELEVRVPDRLVTSRHTLDLGDRRVELHHTGRGHTDADLLVWVPDARVLIAGDVVEVSGPPSYGPDSFPMDWATTLDGVLELAGADATVVPGHGDPVGVEFVREQRAFVQRVADQITALYRAGIAVADAPAAGAWPGAHPDHFEHAVPRGYGQLTGVIS